MEDRYLGYGVYASFDGFQIRLWARRKFDTHEIYLDSNTYATLTDYVNHIKQENVLNAERIGNQHESDSGSSTPVPEQGEDR